LVKNKFVVQKRGGLQKLNGWFPLQKNLIAIELKRDRIKEAWLQAMRYLVFANSSYVGFPMNVAKGIVESRRKKMFYQSGIGVLGISKNTVEVLLKPCAANREIEVDLIFQVHAVERFWKKYQTRDN